MTKAPAFSAPISSASACSGLACSGLACSGPVSSGPAFSGLSPSEQAAEDAVTVTVLLVDAFTTEVGKGNRAGVVLDAEGLSAEQMQAVAAYVNVSETAFVLPPAQRGSRGGPQAGGAAGIVAAITDDGRGRGGVGPDAADMLVRFFTPVMEVPVCGHATIATHYALARLFSVREANVAMDTGAGRLPVLIGTDGRGEPEITMTLGEPQIGTVLDNADRTALAAALGIRPDDVRDDLPAQYVSTGSQVVILPLREAACLHSMRPDFSALAALTPRLGCAMFYVFAFAGGRETFRDCVPESGADPAEAPFFIDGRMFCPAEGIDEDPVTGTANGPAGIYLAAHGVFDARRGPDDGAVGDDTISFTARQGYAMGRAGLVEVTVYRFGGMPVAVQIAGKAVMAGSMRLNVPRCVTRCVTRCAAGGVATVTEEA